jgi:N-acetylmuramoyl-L-alanine amidase
MPKEPIKTLPIISERDVNDEIAADTDPISLSAGGIETDELRKGLEGFETIIAIDPGHGGPDYGVTLAGKLKEKHIVMEIASRLNKLLKKAGLKSYLTRNGDYFLKFDKRLEHIVSRKPDLVISLHCDGAFEENAEMAGGITIFYNISSKEVTSGSSISSGDIGDEEIAKQVGEILKGNDCQKLEFESKELAQSIEKGILEHAKSTTSRGIRGANLLLLKEAQRVGVHVELGFITSPIDSKMLEDPDYREKLAEGIFYGVKDFIMKNGKKGVD